MKTFYHPYRNIITLILPVFIFLISSCDNSDDDIKEPAMVEQTVFMYMPWSGEDIYGYFLDNISAFEKSIKDNKGLYGKKLIVFISSNGSNACMINISYKGNKCIRDTLRKYTFNTPEYTTSSGIRSILTEMMTEAPAKNYAMIIGCHGMGWIPVGTTVSHIKKKNAGAHKTRYFGHSYDSKYQTDITTLAEGIKTAGVRMDYILFDDCYMSNIETAYDLKDVTNYMIASTCEIMIVGMPYDLIGSSLLKNDFKGVCDNFYSFYSNYETPCGTIGVTDCREIERIAAIMKEINTSSMNGNADISGIQTLDGLYPTVFFDFGDYVTKFCKDEELLHDFNVQLGKLVPYKANTEKFYSSFTNAYKQIKAFSGLTISDPTTNVGVRNCMKQTAWYLATH